MDAVENIEISKLKQLAQMGDSSAFVKLGQHYLQDREQESVLVYSQGGEVISVEAISDDGDTDAKLTFDDLLDIEYLDWAMLTYRDGHQIVGAIGRIEHEGERVDGEAGVNILTSEGNVFVRMRDIDRLHAWESGVHEELEHILEAVFLSHGYRSASYQP